MLACTGSDVCSDSRSNGPTEPTALFLASTNSTKSQSILSEDVPVLRAWLGLKAIEFAIPGCVPRP